jgi:hypothetical protein
VRGCERRDREGREGKGRNEPRIGKYRNPIFNSSLNSPIIHQTIDSIVSANNCFMGGDYLFSSSSKNNTLKEDTKIV